MKAIPFLVCLLAGCAGLAVEAPPTESSSFGARTAPLSSPTTAPVTGRDWETKSMLYARDGTPIPASGPGATSSQDPTSGVLPARQLIGDDAGGRMYILELYQSAIEERDSLTTEITGLTAELERARRALIEADDRIAELEAEQSALARDKQGLIDENLELAGRLTTAQIRRLQAEKILLEKELAHLRSVEVQPLSGAEEASQP